MELPDKEDCRYSEMSAISEREAWPSANIVAITQVDEELPQSSVGSTQEGNLPIHWANFSAILHWPTHRAPLIQTQPTISTWDESHTAPRLRSKSILGLESHPSVRWPWLRKHGKDLNRSRSYSTRQSRDNWLSTVLTGDSDKTQQWEKRHYWWGRGVRWRFRPRFSHNTDQFQVASQVSLTHWMIESQHLFSDRDCLPDWPTIASALFSNNCAVKAINGEQGAHQKRGV